MAIEEHFKSKEALLQHVRDSNRTKYPTEDYGGSANAGRPLWDTISVSSGFIAGDAVGERSTTSSGDGGDGSIKSSARGAARDDIGSGADEGWSGERNGSVNQHSRPDAGGGIQATIGANLKHVFSPFSDALRGKPQSTVTAKKTVKKEPEKKLTDSEVLRFRPKLIEFVLWTSEHLDEFIIATTIGHDPNIVIWSNIDNDEAEVLADFLLLRGKTDPVAAHVVREMVTFLDKVKVALIVGPRMYQTGAIYLQRGFSIR